MKIKFSKASSSHRVGDVAAGGVAEPHGGGCYHHPGHGRGVLITAAIVMSMVEGDQVISVSASVR